MCVYIYACIQHKGKRGIITNGGRHSFACLRRTENPPCVLVSEAVKTLQNEWTVGLGGSSIGLSGLLGSLCYKQIYPVTCLTFKPKRCWLDFWAKLDTRRNKWQFSQNQESQGQISSYIWFWHQSNLCINFIGVFFSLHRYTKKKLWITRDLIIAIQSIYC